VAHVGHVGGVHVGHSPGAQLLAARDATATATAWGGDHHPCCMRLQNAVSILHRPRMIAGINISNTAVGKLHHPWLSRHVSQQVCVPQKRASQQQGPGGGAAHLEGDLLRVRDLRRRGEGDLRRLGDSERREERRRLQAIRQAGSPSADVAAAAEGQSC
jgi:hypothetical protein